MTERQIDDRVAIYLSETRNDAKITQSDMAKKMGVSRRTIQSWELGESFPKLSKIIQWMHVTKANPIRILQEISAPVFDQIKGSDEDARIALAVKERVESLRIKEKRDLLFILFGNHGSSVYAFLQLCVAYLQCPMGDRQNITLTIINNYKNAKEMGTIVSPGNIQPDMAALESAYEKGRQAYIHQQKSYLNLNFEESDSEQ